MAAETEAEYMVWGQHGLGQGKVRGLDKVVALLAEREHDFRMVAKGIGLVLKAALIPESGHPQILRIATSGLDEVAEFSRRTQGDDVGVAVSTKDDRMTLIAHVAPWDQPLLDRGLAWIAASGHSESTMYVMVRPAHGLGQEELQEQLKRAFDNGDAFIEGILSGDVAPPFSGDYPKE